MTANTGPINDDASTPSVRSVLASISLLGVGSFVVATTLLHFVQPGLDPMREAVSYYVNGRVGWALTVGLVALGIGSAALTLGVARALTGGRAGVACLAVWSIGAFLGGVFPADPPGAWDRLPSTAGAIHGIAAIIALTVLPVAALLLAPAFRRDPRWRRLSKALTAFAILTAVCYATFVASLVPVFFRPGPPVLLGVTERALLAAGAAWIAASALGLLRRE